MNWIVSEMESIETGDERLNQRAVKLLEDMSSDPQASIPKSCQSWTDTKAAYRFFDNRKITQECLLAPHQKKTMQRIKESYERKLCMEFKLTS